MGIPWWQNESNPIMTHYWVASLLTGLRKGGRPFTCASYSTLQMSTKCLRPVCCSPARSNLRSILPTGFLRPPILLQYSQVGPVACSSLEDDGFFGTLADQIMHSGVFKARNPIPFDLFCPRFSLNLMNL